MPLPPEFHIRRYFAPGDTNVFTGPTNNSLNLCEDFVRIVLVGQVSSGPDARRAFPGPRTPPLRLPQRTLSA